MENEEEKRNNIYSMEAMEKKWKHVKMYAANEEEKQKGRKWKKNQNVSFFLAKLKTWKTEIEKLYMKKSKKNKTNK